ncbi:MAG TPA: ribosome biogenesis GTPase Der [Brevundimonas sp.]|uniref:ribosome biogenesis GTPase Der n=1 Tax=Brevundimonas sp. TaxID=1871086 RepID=UPI002B6B99C3|nr:ribosome biogenesis GTPase Der [Brevundimonas sp.]HRH20615.1 ribosome biogenesis GTPase Der [Brevundimonas sp.]
MSLKVAIVGRPNVGKSTLFNRLAGKKLAIVDDRPGVTRDRRYARGLLGDIDLTLIDTAGFEDVSDESLESRMRRQTELAVEEADLILFVIDAREGIVPLDRIFADLVRKRDKPTLLIGNKAEGKAGDVGLAEAVRLGFGDPIALSAEHGEGMADLYAAVLPFEPEDESDDDEAGKPIMVAIMGRPNAGKSTLVNRLLGEDRMLTGPEAGITRDSISVDFEWDGRPVRLVDTAGMRRKARVQEKLEKLSVADTIRALTFAEVVVLMMDEANAFDTQDLQLADLVEREGRALVYCISKWDRVDDGKERLAELREEADRLLPQLKGSPLIALSAQTGRGVDRLMPAVFEAHRQWSAKVKTRDLNDWLALAVQRHPPPAVDGRRIKPKYMTQTKARPPTFVLFANRASQMPDHYKRYLINSLRESFDLPGVPMRLTVKSGANPFAEGPGPEKTAPRRHRKAEAAEAREDKPRKPKVATKRVTGLKPGSGKKSGSTVLVGKRARTGARAVSRSGRIRTAPKGSGKR